MDGSPGRTESRSKDEWDIVETNEAELTSVLGKGHLGKRRADSLRRALEAAGARFLYQADTDTHRFKDTDPPLSKARDITSRIKTQRRKRGRTFTIAAVKSAPPKGLSKDVKDRSEEEIEIRGAGKPSYRKALKALAFLRAKHDIHSPLPVTPVFTSQMKEWKYEIPLTTEEVSAGSSPAIFVVRKIFSAQGVKFKEPLWVVEGEDASDLTRTTASEKYKRLVSLMEGRFGLTLAPQLATLSLPQLLQAEGYTEQVIRVRDKMRAE